MVAFIAATLFLYSCKNDDTSGKQRTEQQQKALNLLDDSINVMSPSAPAMAAKGMKTATDSLSFYEYAVRAATISGVYNKSDSCFTLSKKALSYALKIKNKTPRVNELIGRCYSNLGSFYFANKDGSGVGTALWETRLRLYDGFGWKSKRVRHLRKHRR
jgi:hypothetical protein